MRIALVAIGYDRPDSMKRLLDSLEKATYGSDLVPLYISIDYSGTDSVEKTANEFHWSHGEKSVLAHSKRLGLRNHILSCGKLLDKYDALVVFEDDIVTSNGYYNYVKQTVDAYGKDQRIAGISLYSHKWNVNASLPFEPEKTMDDVFLLQFAQSWGQVWLKDTWEEFVKWYEIHKDDSLESIRVPQFVADWPKSSWLKYHIKFCIDTNKYFVYPYESLTTCFTEAGEHSRNRNVVFQVQMAEYVEETYSLPKFDKHEKSVIYDAFFEREGLASTLGIKDSEFDCDIYGIKEINPKKRYLLSSKRLKYKIVRRYALEYRPHERNIINGLEGNDLFLYDTSEGKLEQIKIKSSHLAYYFRLDSGLKTTVNFSWNLTEQKFKSWFKDKIGIK